MYFFTEIPSGKTDAATWQCTESPDHPQEKAVRMAACRALPASAAWLTPCDSSKNEKAIEESCLGAPKSVKIALKAPIRAEKKTT